MEDLFKNREPVPEMKAIYFMSPTAKVCHYNHIFLIQLLIKFSCHAECKHDIYLIPFFFLISQCVEAFIADFKTKPKYKAAYVYFTDCK